MENHNQLIEPLPEKPGAPPIFVGTDVPIENLFDYLKTGRNIDDFLADFPSVSRAKAINTIEVLKEKAYKQVGYHEDSPIPITENKDPHPFVVEQFTQFNEHRRQVNSFSWQLLALGAAPLAFLISLSPDIFTRWQQTPWIPAITFFMISVFVVLLFISHDRNRTTRVWLDEVIQEMERMHGNRLSQYGFKFGYNLKEWQRFSSARLLTFFLFGVLILNLIVCFFYLFMWIGSYGRYTFRS